MVGPGQNRADESLRDLLGSVTEYGQQTAENSAVHQQRDSIGETGEGRMTARLTTLVSILALVFSSFSFYETVLKQASLRIYQPPLIHMFRQGFRDVLAIPITISNDGARRGTVLSFDLQVTHPETKEVRQVSEPAFRRLTQGRRETVQSDYGARA